MKKLWTTLDANGYALFKFREKDGVLYLLDISFNPIFGADFVVDKIIKGNEDIWKNSLLQ